MSQIIEIYPDVESLERQVEARKKFGWASSISINDRGVFEVTFTRDDKKAKNKKLKELEDDFMQCSAAADYIERYDRVYADKKKFKAFHPLLLIILIYILFQFGMQAIITCGLKALYIADPSIIYNLELNVSVGWTSELLTADWEQVINLEELGLYSFLSMFGVKEKMLTLTVDVLVDFLFVVGLVSGVVCLFIIFFMISKAVAAKSFYKAEVEYIKRRKELLNGKADDLEKRMDEIILEVERT